MAWLGYRAHISVIWVCSCSRHNLPEFPFQHSQRNPDILYMSNLIVTPILTALHRCYNNCYSFIGMGMISMIGLNADWKTDNDCLCPSAGGDRKAFAAQVEPCSWIWGTGKTRAALELVWLRRKRIAKCVWCCPCLMEETKREILRHTSCIDTDIHTIGPGRGRRTYHRAGGILSGWKASAVLPAWFMF